MKWLIGVLLALNIAFTLLAGYIAAQAWGHAVIVENLLMQILTEAPGQNS